MTDRIRLRDILCYGYTGVLNEERTLGQRFVVQADLEVDLLPAGHSDHLGDTVDYVELIGCIRATVTDQKFYLLEALAEAIATRLKQDSRVRRVRVEVCKPQPPIPEFTGTVAVEVWR